jgi:zinc transport system substrate-binding protein
MNLRFPVVFLLVVLLTACDVTPSPEDPVSGLNRDKVLVIASNYPLYYFAHRIAGDSAEVVFPSMQGDPANWKPGSDSIAQMQSADLVILNGAAYESWLNWISLPPDVLLDTSAGFRERLLPLEQETIHQHGPQGEHSHSGLAFTVWLDPILAMQQARSIEVAISQLVPQNQDAHRARLAELEADLATLDEALQSAFGAIEDKSIVFSHPVYQYLAARYELDGISMHWEPDEDPGIKAWIDFQEALRRHPAILMIWEEQPGQQTVSQLEQLGIRPIVFHTASNLPEESDYFDVMYANIERLGSDLQ